ncbi:hypothetical protein [Caldimonas brevitalea]|uniref:Uncharacterized protein n=1 Tax=Caldimonas brevitalea TaxID=413882 RepID=A0A0G3BX44_9BURK|nr:hypothetical protein [Caldimonas brevitalea]AKJ31936.1 hypothetical protein AAW51_5245 [Caldimonas brevitalea]
MTAPIQLAITAESEDEFEDLLSRGQMLLGLVATIKQGSSTYSAPIVRQFNGDPTTNVVSFEFDGTALVLLGRTLDGRAALAAAEQATIAN